MKHLTPALLFIVTTAGILFLSSTVHSQSSEEAAVKSIKEKVVEMKGDKEIKRLESAQHFDSKGKLVEVLEYETDGKVKSHFTYEYNDDGKKIKEVEFTPDGKVLTVTIFVYDMHGSRISKTQSDRNGTILQKKEYEYEYY